MGDKHGGQAERRDQILEFLPHLLAQKGVERGKRLVKEIQLGLMTMALAKATRCCCPPESWWGYRASKSSRWTVRSASRTLLCRFFVSFLARSPNATFSNTVMCGQSAKS